MKLTFLWFPRTADSGTFRPKVRRQGRSAVGGEADLLEGCLRCLTLDPLRTCGWKTGQDAGRPRFDYAKWRFHVAEEWTRTALLTSDCKQTSALARSAKCIRCGKLVIAPLTAEQGVEPNNALRRFYSALVTRARS